jgi:undecaprenyl phosphate N,N'-diacetylbacillosamine 1-phosphate transferase
MTRLAATSTFYGRWGKRVVDVIAAALALLLVWPLLLLCAILIKVTSRGPVLFNQERLGKGGTTFVAFKFRTMTDKPRTPDTIAYLGDPSEITFVGKVFRRWKLDELPQFFNVLRGEMSIVGPRPQLPIQLPDFNDDAKLRLLVRPGLTGMAQTYGGTVLTWPERWYYDALYVRTMSFALDCALVLRTLRVLAVGDERCTQRPELAND